MVRSLRHSDPRSHQGGWLRGIPLSAGSSRKQGSGGLMSVLWSWKIPTGERTVSPLFRIRQRKRLPFHWGLLTEMISRIISWMNVRRANRTMSFWGLLHRLDVWVQEAFMRPWKNWRNLPGVKRKSGLWGVGWQGITLRLPCSGRVSLCQISQQLPGTGIRTLYPYIFQLTL